MKPLHHHLAKNEEQNRASPACTISVQNQSTSANFMDIYREQASFIFELLQRFGVYPQDLDDAFQETCIALHKAHPSFDPSKPLKPWIYGITLRIAARTRRAHVKHKTSLHEPIPDSESQAFYERTKGLATPSPEEILIQEEHLALVHEAISSMDEEKRAVFVLYEIEEQSTEQIAGLLDIPMGTVHSRMHHARIQFQECFTRLQK